MPFRRAARLDSTREAEDEEESISRLLRRLGNDTAELVQAEIALAKLEVRELVRQAALDGAKLGAAAAVAFLGLLALLAWAILALGDVLGGRHATAALLVGLLLLIVGAVLAVAGRKGLQRAGKPQATLRSLEKDRQLAREHLRSAKEEWHRSRDAAPAPLPRSPVNPSIPGPNDE